MNANSLYPMKLNVIANNSNEVENIIERLHRINAIPYLNNGSLSILKVTLNNHEEIVKIIDRLYKISAIPFSDWSLVNLQLLNKHIALTLIETTNA